VSIVTCVQTSPFVVQRPQSDGFCAKLAPSFHARTPLRCRFQLQPWIIVNIAGHNRFDQQLELSADAYSNIRAEAVFTAFLPTIYDSIGPLQRICHYAAPRSKIS